MRSPNFFDVGAPFLADFARSGDVSGAACLAGFARRGSFDLILALVLLPQIALAQYAISTIAGGGPNNLPALQASVGNPEAVVLDAPGNAYISDFYSSQILKVSTTGTVTVVAGNGTVGYSGDGGPATSAALNSPEGIFVDASGNIFIADMGNSVIQAVNTGTSAVTIAGVAIQPGNIATVAGNFSLGAGYSGDGGPATSAQLANPFGVFVDASGNIFIADTDNSAIREVASSNGNIQTVAGTGTACTTFTASSCGDGGPASSAQLNLPEGVFLDSTGNIFISDTDDSVVRVVNTSAQPVTVAGITIPAGDIETVAGTFYDSSNGSACQFTGAGGPATSAFLCEPNGLFVDSSENIFIADEDNYAIREVNSTGTLTTVAGTPGTFGNSGNGGLATAAVLNYTAGVFVDASANIYIADVANFTVQEVTASNGDIQIFAGNGTIAYSGDGGPAAGAELNSPGGIFVDALGNVYIADTINNTIRVANTGAQPTIINGVTIQPGDIQTVAGNGTFCAAPAPGGCGDGGPATSAQLNFPYGVSLDASGNIYIADTGLGVSDSAIRVVNIGANAITIAGTTIQPGNIETVAGTLGTVGFSGDGGAPASASLSDPQGVVLDTAGNIYIADTGNSAIRVVNTGTATLTIGAVSLAPGTIQTIAGTPPTSCDNGTLPCGDNGPANAASLNAPQGLVVDSFGNIYVADTFDSAIRAINPSANPVTIAGTTVPPGDILTVAGTIGQLGYFGDNGLPTTALLNNPWGIAVDSLGNLYISDTDNSVLRQVVAQASPALIQTIAGTGFPGFSGDGGSSTSAMLNGPQDSVVGSGGTVIFADSQNMRIRQLISLLTVSVSPSSATVPLSGTQQFLAIVTNTLNQNVIWQVNGATGGNASVGTISTAGLYTAPATQPSTAITTTAIAVANGTTSGSATVTIAAAGTPTVDVTTTPPGTTVVYTSATQPFTATVTGETNTAVTWEVDGVAGGGGIFGTIDANGNYTAPAGVPSGGPVVTITAVSQADSTVSGSYPITLASPPQSVPPGPQTISPGGSASFSISLNAATGDPYHPTTLSCLASSLPPGATCTFNPPAISPTKPSSTLTVSVPARAASFEMPQGTWLAPQSFVVQSFFSQSYALFLPVVVIVMGGLLIIASGRSRRWLAAAAMSVFVLAFVACSSGGRKTTSTNPVTYTIQIQGTTPAAPTPVTITTASLTVQ